eukprot:scaffold535_cov260-Pinguiococcus_pyrenoidosus.AAC.24
MMREPEATAQLENGHVAGSVPHGEVSDVLAVVGNVRQRGWQDVELRHAMLDFVAVQVVEGDGAVRRSDGQEVAAGHVGKVERPVRRLVQPSARQPRVRAQPVDTPLVPSDEASHFRPVADGLVRMIDEEEEAGEVVPIHPTLAVRVDLEKYLLRGFLPSSRLAFGSRALPS